MKARISAVLLLMLLSAARAEGLHAIVQQTPLAGFNHHAGPAVWHDLREGDALTLVLERDNGFDAQAVRIDWRAHKLGYLPAAANGAIARELARGTPLKARIGKLRTHPDPRERIRVDILLPL